jgi:hypothetical protein
MFFKRCGFLTDVVHASSRGQVVNSPSIMQVEVLLTMLARLLCRRKPSYKLPFDCGVSVFLIPTLYGCGSRTACQMSTRCCTVA